jgi:hypothetical protein
MNDEGKNKKNKIKGRVNKMYESCDKKSTHKNKIKKKKSKRKIKKNKYELKIEKLEINQTYVRIKENMKSRSKKSGGNKVYGIVEKCE